MECDIEEVFKMNTAASRRKCERLLTGSVQSCNKYFRKRLKKTKIRKKVVTYKRKSSVLAQGAAKPWTLEGSERGHPNDEETLST